MYRSLHTNGPLPLPTELTAEIFKLAISVDFDTLSHRTARLTNPLILAAVCHAWRNFVFDFPALWRIIVLNMSASRYNAQIRILKGWLENSGTTPLQIWLNADSYWDGWEADPPLYVLQQLVEHSERWERIDLCVIDDPRGRYIDILRKIKGKIPLLRACHLRPSENASIPRKKLEMFEEAPLLEDFTISILYVEDITLPWTQLTSFHGRLELTECLTILIRCVNLEECTFHGTFDDWDNALSTDGGIINMAHLSSLTLSTTEEHIIKDIINRIRCPKLRRLQVTSAIVSVSSGFPQRTDFPLIEIEELITRSHCALENLDLESYSFPYSYQVLRVLEKAPSLKTLTLRTEISSDVCFDAFTEQLDISINPAFLPNLTQIRYITASRASLMLKNAITRLAVALNQRQQPPNGISKFLELFIEVADESQNEVEVTDEWKELAGKEMKITIQGVTL